MLSCSHITNDNASAFVRTFSADIYRRRVHIANMARRGIPKGPVRWYLREWMAASGLRGRGAQAKMMELTGWSKATMSQLYNGTQGYNPKIIEEAAKALAIEEFELLMHPDQANAYRRLRGAAMTIIQPDPPEGQPGAAATGTHS